ncbi:MAG TPA: LysR family transcriptional regulator [Ramlibacter sp.]|jgi:DNA-binding transcriptional LysR family regulator
MKDLDLTSLRYFVAVCETGSLTRAAESEHIGVSAVSKRLAQLESDLAVELFQRGRRGVVTTAAGETLLDHARSILLSAQRIADDMAGFSSGLRGKVHLLASISAIAQSLPDDVAAFMQVPAHSDVQVDIEEAGSHEIVQRVRDGTARLGIVWDAIDLDGLEVRSYRVDHLAAVVHPDHPLAQQTSCSFADTIAWEQVSLHQASAAGPMLLHAAGLHGRRVRYRATVSNFESALRVVRANLAIAIIPAEIATGHASAMQVKAVPLSDPWARRQFVVCWRADEALPKAAELLAAYLHEATEAAAGG